MNLREGTRRLALLLGALGAIIGGIASFYELHTVQTVLRERADHMRFEQLINSGLVSRERDAKKAWLAKVTRFSPSSPYTYVFSFSDFTSKVDQGGIHQINWTDNFEVQSIETQDGQILRPTSAPAWPWWDCLLIAAYPVLGFLVPWGSVRAIGWVVAGFVQPLK